MEFISLLMTAIDNNVEMAQLLIDSTDKSDISLETNEIKKKSILFFIMCFE